MNVSFANETKIAISRSLDARNPEEWTRMYFYPQGYPHLASNAEANLSTHVAHITPGAAPCYVPLRHGQIEMSRGKIAALNSSRSKSSLLVNPSTLFSLLVLLFFCLEDGTEAELFLPLSLLAIFRFCYQGFLFYFFNLLFFFSLLFPTANRVVGEYKISQFRQRPNIPGEQEQERERNDQHLPNSLSTPPCIFPFL